MIPPAAQRARIRGEVVLELAIDETGHVVDVEVIQGLPLGITESAVRAARHWRYRPATRGGEPVAETQRVEIAVEPPGG